MKFYDFQRNVLKTTKGLRRTAYYLDMGLGKTFVGAEQLKRTGNLLNVVVCQKSKIQDWLNHFKTHYPKIRTFDCTIKGFCYETHVHLWGYDSSPHVLIINYDLIFRRPWFLQLERFTLLLDESSLIQNEKAKRSKFILKMNPSHVILLSGTPTSGKYENLWSQINLLGWPISNDLYNRQFVNWKTIEVGGFPIRTVDQDNPYRNTDRLKEKLRQHGAIFMKTDDVFSLPEQNIIPVTLPVTKEYRQFKKSAYLQIGDEELIGDSTLTKRLYLRMLCGQYHPGKLEAVKDLLESTRERFIIYYNFNAELEQLKAVVEQAQRPLSQVNGPVKDLEAYETQDDSVTLIQYQTGAMGLNLQKANRIIYYTLTEKSELFEQSKKRIHRIGQDKPCFYYLLLCEGSIEEHIHKTLQMRQDYTDELFKEYELE